LRFTVRQAGPGFCHLSRQNCWAEARGFESLEARIAAMQTGLRPGSYTARLASEPGLLRAKLIEEAGELADAGDHAAAVHEAADLAYFAAVAASLRGVTLAEVARELDSRARRLSRRGGERKQVESAGS
jgi:phosphoribosyl-ATP pyrophosphohydrolase